MALATFQSDTAPTNYELVEAAIEYFREHQLLQPSLAEVAADLGVSEGHLHRLFRDWTGLTPKQFLQSLTVDKAKELLKHPATLLDTALDVGLSGASRLHDHFVTLEAMTPADYRDGGVDLTIQYGTVATPFGNAFIAFTDRGVCQFTFADGVDGEDGEQRLLRTYGRAQIRENQAAAEEQVAPLWQSHALNPRSLRLLVKGTNFQIQVWRALLEVQSGQLVDYSAIARQIGQPTATRAVASAIGANPVAVFIPCHRVIRRDGGLGGYRWGLARKHLLLVKEQHAD
jgi:AraC family transcriptional regulator of adaptative response/methylated-DNA-[protein]-cysteine methyltransferase